MLCHIQLTLHFLLSSNILRQHIYITLSQKIGFICQELFWICVIVYLVYLYGEVLIFYMNNCKWTKCLVEKNNNWDDMYSRDTGLKGSVVESVGQIIHVVPEWQCRVDWNKQQRVHFDFYRLNTRRIDWDKMSIGELRDR